MLSWSYNHITDNCGTECSQCTWNEIFKKRCQWVFCEVVKQIISNTDISILLVIIQFVKHVTWCTVILFYIFELICWMDHLNKVWLILRFGVLFFDNQKPSLKVLLHHPRISQKCSQGLQISNFRGGLTAPPKPPAVLATRFARRRVTAHIFIMDWYFSILYYIWTGTSWFLANTVVTSDTS